MMKKFAPIALIGLVLSANAGAEGFNERGEDWIAKIPVNSPPKSQRIVVNTGGYNERGVDWTSRIPVNSLPRAPEIYIVDHGYNQRGVDWIAKIPTRTIDPDTRIVQRDQRGYQRSQ